MRSTVFVAKYVAAKYVKIFTVLRRKLNGGENYCDRKSEWSRRKRYVIFGHLGLFV